MKNGFFIIAKRPAPVKAEHAVRFGLENAGRVFEYHKSFPMYEKTPLVKLSGMAKKLGVQEMYIKDESFRFSLNAFKVLGGSWAIGNYIKEKTGISDDALSYESLMKPAVREKLGNLTFVTATDGNHGRGVAWAANRFGFRSVVYMPKGSAQERLQNIKNAGAEAYIMDMNYDDCVRLAKKMADEHGWVMVQDTAWEGYEDIPAWIMQGYGTMALEAMEDMDQAPTHVFLQAGVGSMAAAVAVLMLEKYRDKRPKIVIVEPNKADCFFKSASAGDGQRRFVTGDMDTIMAGLACGEPCSIAWEILSACADAYISCPDYAAAEGMRRLYNPVGGDRQVISGESGASAFGCVTEIMTDERLSKIKETLDINENSRLLFFSTEGATDRENFRKIVEDGAYPKE